MSDEDQRHFFLLVEYSTFLSKTAAVERKDIYIRNWNGLSEANIRIFQ